MCAKKATKKAPKKRKKRAATKPAKRRSAPSSRKSVPKRQRYNSLGQHEIIYQAWLAEGTIAGATRYLKTIEGFESIDERTVKSIYQEKRSTEDDWDERAREYYRRLAERFDAQDIEEIARLRAGTQRKLMCGLEKLAGVVEKGVPAAAAKILRDLKGNKVTNQERIYGFAKVLQSLMAALRPPEKAGTQVSIDNRKLTLAVTSPREIAQREAKQTLAVDVTRRERAVELARV